MKKLVKYGILFAMVWAALTAFGAWCFQFAIGEVSPAFGLPHLTWWQAFCTLWLLTMTGGALTAGAKIGVKVER